MRLVLLIKMRLSHASEVTLADMHLRKGVSQDSESSVMVASFLSVCSP